ncbi:ornithine carbamoyltransferase [Corynebacterium casei]|uniref:ornithine carbamoyltransferase n=1 Tax=Corynebacterium casei TaxID=160386 RepID=UPI003FD16A3D
MSFRHLLCLNDFFGEELESFLIDVAQFEAERSSTFNGVVAMFFPSTGVHNRQLFEQAALKLGLQPKMLPVEALEKGEYLKEVARSLTEWADVVVVEHPDSNIAYGLAENDAIPVINAMSDDGYPPEVLSVLNSLSETQGWHWPRYLFVAPVGNLAVEWFCASESIGFKFTQSCPDDLRVAGAYWETEIGDAIKRADVVIVGPHGEHAKRLTDYKITARLLDMAPEDDQLIVCQGGVPGQELSVASLAHPSFVGHDFKGDEIPVYQAILARAMG